MKLTSDQRALRDALIEEAQRDSLDLHGRVDPVAHVDRFADLALDAERYGHPWVADYNRHLHRLGAYAEVRSWRRRFRVVLAAARKRGRGDITADLPATTTTVTDSGRLCRQQVLDLGLEDFRTLVEQARADVARAGRRLSIYERVEDALTAGGYRTVGEAVSALGMLREVAA